MCVFRSTKQNAISFLELSSPMVDWQKWDFTIEFGIKMWQVANAVIDRNLKTVGW